MSVIIIVFRHPLRQIANDDKIQLFLSFIGAAMVEWLSSWLVEPLEFHGLGIFHLPNREMIKR